MGIFSKITDEKIIEGIRLQDDVILNWLYDHYLPDVRNHVMKNSGSADDVSDVFQDSIIVLYNQITDGELNLTTDLKGYFFGIAKNVWNNQMRRNQKSAELTIDLPDDEDPEETSDPLLERVVSRAFQKLKPDQQQVLSLFSEGFSYDEIAVEMNLKNEEYARRKKYLCKEALLDLVKEDPEYQEFLRLRR